MLYFRNVILAVCLSAAVVQPVAAQAQALKKVLATQTDSKAATGETPEETAARMQQWLKEARTALSRLNDAEAAQTLPEGIDAAALAEFRRDLEQTIIATNRFEKLAEGVFEDNMALEAARAADADWRGLKETPPYSILMLDELVNQRDSIREKAASYQSSLAIFTRTLSGIQDEARDATEASRRAVAAAAGDSAPNSAASWRLEVDRAKSRHLAVRAVFLRSSISGLKTQVETANSQLSLLDRQIDAARKKAVFSDEDLEKVKKAVADRRAAIGKELASIRKREQEANAVKSRMQRIKDQLLKETPEGTPLEDTPDLALATVKMEASETRVDSLQYVASTLELIDGLEAEGVEGYTIRKAVLDARTKDERNTAEQTLRSYYDRMNARAILLSNELAAVNADIGRQESRAASRPADDPRLLPLNDVRASLWDKQASIQRAYQVATSQSRMLKRWLDEVDRAHAERPLSERFGEGMASLWTRLKNVWSIDVFTYNDTVMIGGVPSTQERGVSLGKFVIAILAFILAYIIAGRIKNRIRNSVVQRGHIADAQANTLGNWSMIVVSLLLALATLHFLRIPLTVFAFLGGALAIGLGFGSQTLIKNFISGIIVLFERKIRVGDVVDVGGISGSITEINTRSSVLRSPDGRETLVPNSVFLETSVTNLTLASRSLRRFINVGVAYGSSPGKVSSILTESAERHGLILKDPAPMVIFQDFGDNALVFKLYFWVVLDAKTNPEQVESDIRLMVEKSFGEAGISFPFPQRDIHIKSDSPLGIALGSQTPAAE